MRVLTSSLACLAAVALATPGASAVPPDASASPPAVSSSAAPAATATPAGKKRFDPSTALVSGSADVVVKTARYYDTNDDNANSTAQEILVATFVWTNDSGIDLVPRIDHFEFVDASGQISTGIESGYTALVGISNFSGTIKRGESHAYSVGFLVPAGDAGQIVYDLST